MNPTLRTYVRGLARRLEVDPTNLSRDLAALQEEGIVTGELEGRQLYYSLNRTPRVRSLLALFEPDIGVEGTLRHALAEVPGVDAAFLYGHEKRPDPASEGELNLAVIGTMSRRAVGEQIHRAGLALARTIRVESYSKKEFGEMPRAKKKLMWHTRVVFPKTEAKSGATNPISVKAKTKAKSKAKARAKANSKARD